MFCLFFFVHRHCPPSFVLDTLNAQDGTPTDALVQLAQEHHDTQIELIFSRRRGTTMGTGFVVLWQLSMTVQLQRECMILLTVTRTLGEHFTYLLLTSA